MSSFKAYVQLGEKHYRENYGIHFEQFEVGQRFKHRPGITLSQQDNKNEALDTLNNAQLHYDQHYAEQTEWKNCLGVSTLTLQYIIGMTWKTFGKKYRIIGFDDISMTHPVFGGDTLYAESQIIQQEMNEDHSPLGTLHVLTQGINQHHQIVCKIQYRMLVYKKGKHPLDSALPNEAFHLTDEKFLSHHRLEDDSYIEEVGLYYEDLALGETYEHWPRKTFTDEEARVHSLHCLEWNPQYSDADYINQYLDGKRWINEAFLVGTITALTTRTFGRVVANLQWKNITLPRAVYAGDTIYAHSTLLAKRESKSRPEQGIIEARTHAFNQQGEHVCSYERHLLVYKRGRGPYQKAGY